MAPKATRSAGRGERAPEPAADLQRILHQAEAIFDLTGNADAREDVALLRRLIALEGDVAAAAAWSAWRIAQAIERSEQTWARSRGGRKKAAAIQQRDATLLAQWRMVCPGHLEDNVDGKARWLVRNGHAPGLTVEATRMVLRKYHGKKAGEC